MLGIGLLLVKEKISKTVATVGENVPPIIYRASDLDSFGAVYENVSRIFRVAVANNTIGVVDWDASFEEVILRG